MKIKQNIESRLETIIRAASILLLILTFSLKGYAGDVVDFGTGAKKKMTLNPAGAAAVDRIYFDFTFFNYESQIQYSPFTDQFRYADSPAYLGFEVPSGDPDYRAFDKIETVKYENGHVNAYDFKFAVPISLFTLGASYDFRNETYENGSYETTLKADTTLFLDGTDVPDVSTFNERTTISYLIAIPLNLISIGFRQSLREIKYKIDHIGKTFVIPEGMSNSPVKETYYISENDPDSVIFAKTLYEFNDYGVIYHLFKSDPWFDLSFLHRPPVEATLEFNPIINRQEASTNYTYETMKFVEPGINLTGLSFAFDIGNLTTQFEFERGKLIDEEKSLEAKLQPAAIDNDNEYDITGNMIRFSYNQIFDITYSIRTQNITGSEMEVISKMIKFPLPIFKKLVIMLGEQQIKIHVNNEIVADDKMYSISFEIEFGDFVPGPLRRPNMTPGRIVTDLPATKARANKPTGSRKP